MQGRSLSRWLNRSGFSGWEERWLVGGGVGSGGRLGGRVVRGRREGEGAWGTEIE